MKKIFTLLIALLFCTIAKSQTSVTGRVIDAKTNQPLVGATVSFERKIAVVTDIEGNFNLNVPGKGKIAISFIGYKKQSIPFDVSESETTDLGIIKLKEDIHSIADIVVVGYGVIDIATGRETPIAVSTIQGKEIELKTGNQEFPSFMKNTPSVYVADEAGGYGDSKVYIRGFKQNNLAVLFNGQPVNGMEDGNVYWSNWQGLSDIASAVQIQRGLGASKLAISSVGATINIVTKATDKKQGGRLMTLLGNDGYQKYTAQYSTGINDKGWGASILLSHWQGDGYNDGTQGQGQTYFFSLGYKPSDKHSFNFSITGAPQWHNQNYSKRLSAHDRDGDGKITNKEQRYNDNWGMLNGKPYTWRKNVYHKPVMNLNWDWNISNKASLSTVLYASVGQGGATGPFGGRGNYAYIRDKNGQIDFKTIVANNDTITPVSVDGMKIGTEKNKAAIRRASMNMHRWFGAVANLNHNPTEHLALNLGTDLRTYFGEHYRLVDDLLGLGGYLHESSKTGFKKRFPGGQLYTREHGLSPYFSSRINSNLDDKLDYVNNEIISYQGLFGQAEYKKGIGSFFVQGALSKQNYQRFDYFSYAKPKEQDSKKLDFIGYNLKAGGNININDQHNVFFNTGYYSRQPFFDDLFLNHKNDINENVGNEGVLGMELGYGFTNNWLLLDLNVYNTKWNDRQLRGNVEFDNDKRGYAFYENVTQLHKGVELNFKAFLLNNLTIGGFASIADWQYAGNITSTVYDENRQLLGNSTLYLDGVKVGNSAQTTMGVNANYEIFKGLSFDCDWRMYKDLYANLDPLSFTKKEHDGSLKLPSFSLLDAGATYVFNISGRNNIALRANVNNLLDKQYITSSSTNIHPNKKDKSWEGINTKNKVFFGNGRTWNISLSFRF